MIGARGLGRLGLGAGACPARDDVLMPRALLGQRSGRDPRRLPGGIPRLTGRAGSVVGHLGIVGGLRRRGPEPHHLRARGIECGNGLGTGGITTALLAEGRLQTRLGTLGAPRAGPGPGVGPARGGDRHAFGLLRTVHLGGCALGGLDGPPVQGPPGPRPPHAREHAEPRAERQAIGGDQHARPHPRGDALE